LTPKDDLDGKNKGMPHRNSTVQFLIEEDVDDELPGAMSHISESDEVKDKANGGLELKQKLNNNDPAGSSRSQTNGDISLNGYARAHLPKTSSLSDGIYFYANGGSSNGSSSESLDIFTTHCSTDAASTTNSHRGKNSAETLKDVTTQQHATRPDTEHYEMPAISSDKSVVDYVGNRKPADKASLQTSQICNDCKNNEQSQDGNSGQNVTVRVDIVHTYDPQNNPGGTSAEPRENSDGQKAESESSSECEDKLQKGEINKGFQTD
jgi:hypothetical protein